MEITAIWRIHRRCIKLKDKSHHGIFPLLSNAASFKMLTAERQGRNAEALLPGHGVVVCQPVCGKQHCLTNEK